MKEVRQVINDMIDEGNIDIFAVDDRMKRKKEGNITFIEFCMNRAEIRKMNKADDSQARGFPSIKTSQRAASVNTSRQKNLNLSRTDICHRDVT